MRPSKLRLPLSTEQTTRLFSRTAVAISSGSGPLLPMQVVQPYPTRLNPSLSRYGVRPAALRYSVTTFDPGARLLLTHGLRVRPFSTAFFATSPAPIITLGFDVFVQLVIAAMTTEPCSTAACGGAATAVPPAATPPDIVPRATIMPGSACANPCLAPLSGTRSCGRFGPARLGSIALRSTSMVSV